MFHLKYRLPFAVAIAALTVVTVTIWTSTTEDGKGVNEQAARWGSATDLRRALTTSFFRPSWTGAADQWAGGATPSIDETEEEVERGVESERAVGDDLVAPFLREEAFTGEDEDDAAVDVVGVDEFGVDESRELQSTCMGQCKGDYQCDSSQPCFKCMYFDRNLDGVCCQPGGGGCDGGGGNRFNVGCDSRCSRDTECNISPCFSCIGGRCQGGVLNGGGNVCGGFCGGGQRCGVGCVCNGQQCVPSGNRNPVCNNRACTPRNSFSNQCFSPCDYCSANGRCIQRNNNNNFGGRCGDSCNGPIDCQRGNCPFCTNVGGFRQCTNNRNNAGGSNNMLGRCNDRCFSQNDCRRGTNNNCNFCDFNLGNNGEGRCTTGNRVVNPIIRGCGERCFGDGECGLNGCNFCVGGVCGGNRFGGNNFRCSGTCIESSMCPAGCSCIARLCQ